MYIRMHMCVCMCMCVCVCVCVCLCVCVCVHMHVPLKCKIAFSCKYSDYGRYTCIRTLLVVAVNFCISVTNRATCGSCLEYTVISSVNLVMLQENRKSTYNRKNTIILSIQSLHLVTMPSQS